MTLKNAFICRLFAISLDERDKLLLSSLGMNFRKIIFWFYWTRVMSIPRGIDTLT